MLSKSLDEVQDEDWIAELGEAFGQQISLYSNMPDEKVDNGKIILLIASFMC